MARVEQEIDILLETLCFHTQQTVEKSLKAVLLREGVHFPYTHDIARLITLIRETELPWAEELDQAAELTGYAIETRYPGSAETVPEEEYHQALAIAEKILIWAENIIEPGTQQGSKEGS